MGPCVVCQRSAEGWLCTDCQRSYDRNVAGNDVPGVATAWAVWRTKGRKSPWEGRTP